jgi:hypothetical protein
VARRALAARPNCKACWPTEWAEVLDPRASDEALLAARAHHVRRWSIARDSYPDGRVVISDGVAP